jgi:hypothetical protein
VRDAFCSREDKENTNTNAMQTHLIEDHSIVDLLAAD